MAEGIREGVHHARMRRLGTEVGDGKFSVAPSNRQRIFRRNQRNTYHSDYCAVIAPPLLVSYESLDAYLSALDQELCDQYGKEIAQLYQAGLPPVVSSRCLAVLFGYSTKFINAIARQNWKYYRTFIIKKGKKRREIQAPKVALKVVQKWFGFHLSEFIQFNEYVHGFVRGRSALSAAFHHTNAKWVYSVDIENYFPSTPIALIQHKLLDIGYSQKASELMSRLLCYRDCLSQGSPASPVVSNLVFSDLDTDLKAYADSYSIRYTRYADDIVFSGIQDFPEELPQKVHAAFNDTPWSLSKDKEYFASLPKRLKVHGLLVHGEKPRLTKGYRNKIRAYKHLIETGQVKDEDRARIIGHIKYAESIDENDV